MNELPEPYERAPNLSYWGTDKTVYTSAYYSDIFDAWDVDYWDGDTFVVVGTYSTRIEAEHHAALLFVVGIGK
jgi:hypothetical protein